MIVIYCLFLLSTFSFLACGTIVVDLGNEEFHVKIAAQACVGLSNRRTRRAAFSLLHDYDEKWLTRASVKVERRVNGTMFVEQCLADGTATGYILYDAKGQQRLLPSVLTLAGLLDAVPLTTESLLRKKYKVSLDVSTVFKGFSSLQATEWVYERYVNETTALAFTNPGYAFEDGGFVPKCCDEKNVYLDLIDFVVARKLFDLYLVNACVPLTKEHAFMEKLTSQNPWPRPIPVYGYNDAWPIAGDIFEAETGCVPSHSMGQINSMGARNLAFFSSEEPITQSIQANPPRVISYDETKTYIGLVVGDGDNIGMLMSTMADFLEDRVKRCRQGGSRKSCFDLMWSVAPAVLRDGPEVLRWFQSQMMQTGHDYVVLPPSGHLYSYPAMMPADLQKLFVEETDRDAQLLNTSGMVDWEFFTSWKSAIDQYYGQYADGPIRAVFGVNVPYFFPVMQFPRGEFFKVFHNSTVLFAPREWRGTSGGNLANHKSFLSPQEMAEEIHAYPPGTVTAIYLTQDGGNSLGTLYDLVDLLQDRVEILSALPLAHMALAKAGREKEAPPASPEEPPKTELKL